MRMPLPSGVLAPAILAFCLSGHVRATMTVSPSTVEGAPSVPEPMQAGYADVGGGEIYYEVFGDGPAVVLIHDGLMHSEVWDCQIGALARGHTVIRYDRRGYGRSEPPTQTCSNIEDLHRLLQVLDTGKVTLVGSSSGGGLAIDLTLAHPEMVDALVLVGAVVDGLWYSPHFVKRNWGNYSPDLDARIARWIDDPYLVAPGNEAARRRVRELAVANPQNFDPTGHQFLTEPDRPALGRLSEIEVPVLIVTAEKDIPDVHAHAGAIQAGIGTALRVVMKNAGHLPYLERPEEFNRIVLDFLSQLRMRLEASRGRHEGRDDLLTRSFVSGFAPVNGAELYFEAMGEGPALVLVHGGTLDHRMWDGQFEIFARHFRVIRYDVQGHGLSRCISADHCDHDDLAMLLKHLKIDKAHVMGLSLGGRIVIDFALEYPELVEKLIPVSSGMSGYQFDAEDLGEHHPRMIEALLAGDIEMAVEFFQRSWTDGPNRRPQEVDPAVRERVRVMSRHGLEPGRDRGEGRLPDPPAIGRLSEIHAPTLTIIGDLDMPVIFTIADLLTEKIDGAEKHVMNGAAHMVNMEQPEAFNQIALRFLTDR
ncbi:MAG: alpha/beta hydrolase [Phycisphaerales bacterium]|nr:MAG: alpha/beta hydrolase [Phycisphaerales bacterium]